MNWTTNWNKKTRKKWSQLNLGAKSAWKKGMLFAPDSSRPFFSDVLLFASRRTKRNKDYLYTSSPAPSLLPTNFDNKHVCTCRNISFLLNLLATGSWYTALGQELILSKMSFSLSSDTGNKLKTKEERQRTLRTIGSLERCCRYLRAPHSEHCATPTISYFGQNIKEKIFTL